MKTKPKSISDMFLVAVTVGMVGLFFQIIAAGSRSSYPPELGGLDYIAWILFLVAGVFGIVATWRLAAAIDWLVDSGRPAHSETGEPRIPDRG